MRRQAKKSPLFVLSKVFLLEILREKWFYGALGLAAALFLLNLALGSLSFAEQERIVFHLSMASIQLVGLAICLIFGISTMTKEIEKQTCLLILARPVSRGQFLLSKGIALAVFVGIFDFGVGVFLGLLLDGKFPWENLISILFTTWMEHVLVLSIALWAGLFLGRAVAGLLTVGTFILGHWLPDLEYFARKSQNEIFLGFAKVLNFIVPHFYEMDQRTIEVLKTGIPPQQLLWFLLHSGGWILIFFLMASQVWRRKDLV